MPLLSTKFRRIARFGRMRGGIDLATAGGSKKFCNYSALAALTNGTDIFGVSGTRFSASVFIPHSMVCTGIGYLIGSVGGTDKALVELHDADGKLIANSALAGVTVGTAATFQELPFAAPVEILGPQWYFLSVTLNGATAKVRALAAGTIGITQLTKSATGTFGTVGDLTVPTTFTADVGPIAYTY